MSTKKRINGFELEPTLSQALGNNISFDTFMDLEGEVFRAVVDRRTLRFEVNERGYFIKIHQGVGWKEIFKNLIQLRLPVLGASNEYHAIKHLTELGVETMRLAGYGCRGLNPARLQSFVITDELQETVTLEEFSQDWHKKPPQLQFKRALIKHIAETAKKMHENGINHRDFYICHFNLRADSKTTEDLHLYLMDLHRAQIRKRTPVRWIIKDIAGIYFSSMDLGLTRRDYLRFVRSYRGLPLSQVFRDEKRFWKRVESKAKKLYIRHQARIKKLYGDEGLP